MQVWGKGYCQGNGWKAGGSGANKPITAGINAFLSPGWYLTFFYCLESACYTHKKWRVIYLWKLGHYKEQMSDPHV